MTEATQTANTTDAREASMSRVSTQETLLAMLKTVLPASEATEVKAEGEQSKEEGDQKAKKTPQERIQELANKRREAEAKADAAERKAAELEARVASLQAIAKPMEATAKPLRSQYATDDDYIEALSDFKAREAIAKRELEQARARDEAEQAEVAATWSKRQESVMKTLPDYAEVIGKSEISVPNHVHQAILESEQGPQIAYYLALHPDEAKRLAEMKPVAGIKRIASLERDLAEIDADDEPAPKDPPKQVQKSKAPPPIDTVKGIPSSSGSSANDYEEYKRRRQASK